MTEEWCWCGKDTGHSDECGTSSDSLVLAVADSLFNSWFPTTTVESMKQQNCYNGEYEIAIEDAKVAVEVFRGWDDTHV